MQYLQLRPGLELAIRESLYWEHILVRNPNREHPLELDFCLSGERILPEIGYVGSSQTLLYGSGFCPQGTAEQFANQCLVRVNIHMEPRLLQTFVGSDSQGLPDGLAPLIRSTSEPLFCCADTTTPAMQLVLQQIMHCPYQGAMKRLYLESKVMELIALRLGQFLEASGGQKRSPSLGADDVERIYRAKEILLQNLTDPPYLATLARRVALNEHKLKVGFRELFDTTVFGYLHTQRMERAKQLLEAGSMTIIAIAQTVGYANRSHFAAAFRKWFGANPMAYLGTSSRKGGLSVAVRDLIFGSRGGRERKRRAFSVSPELGTKRSRYGP
ncbi:MAG: AraC family transcriptional regulator [Cyanobacteria bacterium QH_6_48_35]|nr:MAG: AraC family transcriptional regulator [Cyanobacteria bacterium QH_6_48_35]